MVNEKSHDLKEVKEPLRLARPVNLGRVVYTMKAAPVSDDIRRHV